MLIAAESSPDTLSIRYGDGTGVFDRVPAGLSSPDDDLVSPVSADFNEDGHVDLVTFDDDQGTEHVYLGDGQRQFTRDTIAVGGEPLAVLAEDFDSDGHLDIAVADSENKKIFVLLGDGLGGFGPLIASASKLGRI